MGAMQSLFSSPEEYRERLRDSGHVLVTLHVEEPRTQRVLCRIELRSLPSVRIDNEYHPSTLKKLHQCSENVLNSLFLSHCFQHCEESLDVRWASL